MTSFTGRRSIARVWGTLPINIRRAVRAMRARPSYALMVAATVGLVMAAASVAFAVFDATVLRPLPYPDDGRLAVLYTVPPAAPDRNYRNPLHSIDLIRFQRRSRALAALEGLVVREHAVAVAREAEALSVGHASAGIFPLLGLTMSVGRSFTTDEDRHEQKVAVLGHALSQVAFGTSARALGAKILVDGEPHEVVGVLDAKSRVPFANVDLWTPLGISEANQSLPFATFILGIGRLAPGVSIAAADRELQQLMAELGQERPTTHEGWKAGVVTLREWQFGDQRYAVGILMVAAVAVLLVAWINILNVSMGELLNRRNEIAVCVSLGAARIDLVITQLVGVTILIGAGVTSGLIAASLILRILQRLGASSLGPVGDLGVDARVQVFAGVLSAVAAVLVGVVPVSRTLRWATPAATGRVIGSRRARLARAGLVAAQIAAVVTLIASTLVLARALQRLHQVPLGFNSDGVLGVRLRMPTQLYPSIERRASAVRAFIDAIRQVPGVTVVGSATNPLSPGSSIATQIEIEGMAMPNGQPVPVQLRMVAGDYFRALQIPMVSGRPLGDGDSGAAALAAVVSRVFAQRFWPGQDPIGRRLRRPVADPRWLTVVGVVEDVSDTRVGQPPEAILYTSYAQFNAEVAPVALMIRTEGEPAALTTSVRRAILDQSPSQPISGVEPLTAFIDASFAPQQFRALALGFLATLGVALGAVGVYGVISRAVAERVPEIGVRKALGATGWRAVVTAGRDGAIAVGVGIALGIPSTIGAGLLLASALPEIDRVDAQILACSVLGTVTMAMLASLVPLRRAFRLDPSTALRVVC